jgi:flagellar biosynthetic protein FliR
MLTLLFLSLDGHLILVDTIVKSYRALPPGAAWLMPGQLRDIALFGGYAFSAGLLLALPVGFLLLCLNLVMGMLARSAPALNLFAIGLPASLAVGVIALAIAFPAMGDYLQVIVREGLAAAQSLVLG